jgi:hypothetical protein
MIARMLRVLLVGLTLLHLGPGLAFALLAFGCDGAAFGAADAGLAALCARPGLAPFAQITLAGWAVLGAAWAAAVLLRRARAAPRTATGRRLAALAALLATGLALGLAGQWLFGSDTGYLAVPLALAAGWLGLANPSACTRDEA